MGDDFLKFSEEARQWVTLAVLVVPSFIAAYNTLLAHRTAANMAKLEINTNSKMDALLKAAVGEATAVGENKGRADEVERQRTL